MSAPGRDTATAETDAPPESANRAPNTVRILYRTAGIGGIAAFAFWLLQPILVMLIVGDKWKNTSSWQYYQDFRWNGVYEGITFGGIGVGFLVLVAATSLLAERAGEPTVGSRLLIWFGMLAGSVWLLVAGATFALYTSVGYFVRDLVPAVPDQNAVYEAMSLAVTGLLMAFAVLSGAWMVLFAVVGRRRGVIGSVLAALALIAAAGICVALLMPFAPPWGAISGLGYALVLGIGLLVKSRAGRVRPGPRA